MTLRQTLAAVLALLLIGCPKSERAQPAPAKVKDASPADHEPSASAPEPAWVLVQALPTAPPPFPRGPRVDQELARIELQRALKGTALALWDPVTGTPRSLHLDPPLRLKRGSLKAAIPSLLRRLAPIYGRPLEGFQPTERLVRGPYLTLVLERPTEPGESELRLTFFKRGGATYLTATGGKIYRDLPLGLDSPSAPNAQLLLSDHWQYALPCTKTRGGAQYRVLKSLDGRVLREAPLGAAGNTVVGRVFPIDPAHGSKRLPLKGLQPDSIAAGLLGEFEGVEHTGPGFPIANKERLQLIFPDEDSRLDEVNVYHQLGEVRRWFERYRRVLPAKAFTARVAARVRASHSSSLAYSDSTRIQGERFDYWISFGQLGDDFDSRSSWWITHERTHVLLYSLGFRLPLWSDDTVARVTHEALADYFTAVRFGRPRPPGGVFRRDLSELRVFPENWTPENPQEASLILSGALWDARAELGRSLDELVLLVASDLRTARDLHDVLRRLIQTDKLFTGGTRRSALVRAFARHGIGDAETPRPPSLKAPMVSLWPSSKTIQVEATSHSGSAVEVFVSGDVVSRVERSPSLTGTKVTLTIHLDPKRMETRQEVLVLAQDRHGRSTKRIIPVLLEELDDTAKQISLRLAPGEERSLDLERLWDLSSRPRWRVVGGGALGARLEVQEGNPLRHRLTLRAPTEAEGLHVLHLRARAPQRVTEFADLTLLVTVGSGARIDVFAPTPAQAPLLGGTPRSRIPPGQSLLVAAGESLDLVVTGSGQEDDFEDVANAAHTLKLSANSKAPGVEFKPFNPGEWDLVDDGKRAALLRAEGRLLFTPPAETPPGTYTIELCLRRELRLLGGGDAVRRTLQVHVVPARNRAAVVQQAGIIAQLEGHIPLKELAELCIRGTDPDDEEAPVILELEGPPGSALEATKNPPGQSKGKWFRITGVTQATTLVLRARDVHGAGSVEFLIVTVAPPARNEQGVTGALDQARD